MASRSSCWVCNHQDHAGVGTAIPDALHAPRVAQTQGMGANAWRSAHNPPRRPCSISATTNGPDDDCRNPPQHHQPEALDELERMILSSRNHPAIILWSVGNEEGHQGTERGRRMSARWRLQCSSTPRG
jgi:beta-galactosidase